ncbi:MAG TPA: tail fiber protein [Pseudolabrys sp.]|nr:tail fiber protein [Pseudolabrys sp.]
MSDAYMSQIMAFGMNFAPKSWAMCNGQILAIAQNTALFSLLGTTYGGNGTSTFALPNLQSRVSVGFGTSPFGEVYSLGEVAGEENVTLTISTMAAHNHGFIGASSSTNARQPTVDGAALGNALKGGVPGDAFYAPQGSLQPLFPGSILNTGGNQPHPNLQPYLALNWCICQYGIFPSRN